MEALTTLHHRHQPLCSSLHPSSLTSTTASSLFLSNPSPSSPSPSSSIRALSSPSPPSSESLQNLQYPELKTPQFFNPLVKVPNFDPPLQDPEPKSPQFSNPIRKFPSFFTGTVAASAFLFLGCCQNGFNKPVMSLSSVVSIEETLDDDKNDSVEEFLGSKPDHVESVLHLKMKEKVHVVHSFNKTKTNDDEAWLVLRAEIFSCSKNLELIKVGFENILEKDMDCNKVNQDRVLEYLEIVDDCNSYLKSIKVAMDRCERVDADIRFFCKVVDHIRVLEGDMVGALKQFKQNKSE
ncbi:TPR repeat protein [Trifolium pratense]|uniref:TPR repeat protein n=1 Tax=Trifolium pratense TaxID=57577 RepID=A0A2K3NNE7_TRIPR|nr:uncharacterized protein LOC123915584 [Trifolium pratense]PNY04557.1 TPR repeat protein [Trifolium pratense]